MVTVEEYLRVCEEAVRAGGRVVQQWVGRFKVREKGPADLVTQADFASQEILQKIVLGAFPEHGFLGEESTHAEMSGPRAEFRWIADPLDGTTNFVHGVPHYCVSLALERHGALLAGAVYDPTHDECFTAAAGRGTHLNGEPIHASRVQAMSDALAVVGFPYHVRRDSPDVLLFLEMLGRCHGIRRTGSSALNLCYLAAGRYDVYWSYSTHSWDVAAGILILREAGGTATSIQGAEFSLDDPSFLAAANPELHAQLVEIAAVALKQ